MTNLIDTIEKTLDEGVKDKLRQKQTLIEEIKEIKRTKEILRAARNGKRK